MIRYCACADGGLPDKLYPRTQYRMPDGSIQGTGTLNGAVTWPQDGTEIGQLCTRCEGLIPVPMTRFSFRCQGAAPGSLTYENNLYVVTVHRANKDGIIHLSLSRKDRGAVTDWREKQEIKNRLLGREIEAVELYPAESRRVDGANQFHLWCLCTPGVRFPIGFDERLVTDHPSLPGCDQRPGSGATPEDEARERNLVAKHLTR